MALASVYHLPPISNYMTTRPVYEKRHLQITAKWSAHLFKGQEMTGSL